MKPLKRVFWLVRFTRSAFHSIMEGRFAAAAQGGGFGEQEQGGMEVLTSTNTLFLGRFLGLRGRKGRQRATQVHAGLA